MWCFHSYLICLISNQNCKYDTLHQEFLSLSCRRRIASWRCLEFCIFAQDCLFCILLLTYIFLNNRYTVLLPELYYYILSLIFFQILFNHWLFRSFIRLSTCPVFSSSLECVYYPTCTKWECHNSFNRFLCVDMDRLPWNKQIINELCMVICSL